MEMNEGKKAKSRATRNKLQTYSRVRPICLLVLLALPFFRRLRHVQADSPRSRLYPLLGCKIHKWVIPIKQFLRAPCQLSEPDTSTCIGDAPCVFVARA